MSILGARVIERESNLAEFITQNMQPILTKWEAFAATRLPAAEGMRTRAEIDARIEAERKAWDQP